LYDNTRDVWIIAPRKWLMEATGRARNIGRLSRVDQVLKEVIMVGKKSLAPLNFFTVF
jgi:hypothetical protein